MENPEAFLGRLRPIYIFRGLTDDQILEAAKALEPGHFLAQLKYAELLYRLRALPRAEQETQKALELAANGWELGLARRQLQEIRSLRREGTQRPAWTRSLVGPALALAGMFLLLVMWSGWR